MNSSNRKKNYIIIGAVILLLIGLYVVFVGRQNNSDSSSNNNDRTETQSDTYRSSQYNFSFQIPEGYDLIEVTSPNDRRHSIVMSKKEDANVPENGEGPTAITVDVFPNVTSTSIATWVRANTVSNFGQSTTPLTDGEVAGTPSVSYSWDGLYRGRSVAFIHEKNAILVSGTYLETSDKIYSDFDKVVSTFTLGSN